MPGYKISNLSEIKRDLLCTICKWVLREPRQTFCGHRLCKTCLLTKTSNHFSFECCGEDCTVSVSRDDVFPDKSTEREILHLPAQCKNKTEGCTWTGMIKEYDQHLATCRFETINCEILCCEDTMLRKDLTTHLATVCKYRDISCEFCNLTLKIWELEKHLSTCLKYPCKCKSCNLTFPREQMLIHNDPVVGTCKEISGPCPFVAIGCSENSNLSSKKRQEHMKTNLVFHMNQILSHNISQIKKRNDETDKFEALDQRMKKFEKESLEQIDKNACYCSMLEDLKVSVQELKKEWDWIKNNPTILDYLDISAKRCEERSFNGVLVWKIHPFSEERLKAQRRSQISFYSPAFYTDPYGYKMCLRVYLNGDGMGKGTHISLFFVVMQGEYDALLRWPFRQKVTLFLLDQGNQEHKIDSFRPDISSSSFQRPRNHMNVASGAPLFFPLEDLNKHKYVVDDTIFFKAVVDKSDSY